MDRRGEVVAEVESLLGGLEPPFDGGGLVVSELSSD